ncbi:MAG: flagellar assembly protein FliH [Treponema sp.]
MAKTVFRANEFTQKDGEVMLKLIHDYTPVEEIVEEVEEFTGPTPDQLRRDAEAFKAGWEIEKQRMLEEAQKSADEIVKKAEDAAFAEVKRQSEQAQVIKANAEKTAQEVVKQAQEEAQKILSDARTEEESIKENARLDGFSAGHDEGFAKGSEEVDRLIERMHKILESVMQRREEILSETEQQIVELVVLMTRKVVKVISDNQKSVINNNVLAALKKVKGRGSVTLRVNLEDLKLTTQNTDEFIKRCENIQGITVMEDSTVEKGGCIVETDFGAIDARISSQLTEVENRVMEVSPVKSVAKSSVSPQ